MTEKEILINQISTDIKELRKDVNAGLYEENVKGFLKEVGRIADKMRTIKQMEEEEKWRCPECGEVRKGDARVEAGMKCGYCAY